MGPLHHNTGGLVHALNAHPANIQDGVCAQLLLSSMPKEDFPRMQRLWMDSGYAG
ncbi:hypothetical protein P2318_28720 [Myxococcaceae bacterium GXIMD 01537]